MMSEAIRSPKELQDVADESKIKVKKYLCKFVNAKYKFEFADIYYKNNREYETIRLYFADAYKTPYLKIIISYLDISVMLCSNDGNYGLYDIFRGGPINNPPIDKIKLDQLYKPQYLPAIMHFCQLDNIKEFCDYIKHTFNFLYLTTYIPSLTKAYTFLLSNNKNKIFPKEIAKLIVCKLLFFLPPKN